MKVLTKMRKAQGMTQAELCVRSGVDEARISKAENYGSIGASQLERIAAALDWQGEPQELLKEVGS